MPQDYTIQFDFMPERSTAEVLHPLKKLVQQYKDKQRDLHIVFIDLEKAYEKVPKEILLRCLKSKSIYI